MGGIVLGSSSSNILELNLVGGRKSTVDGFLQSIVKISRQNLKYICWHGFSRKNRLKNARLN